MSAAQPRWRRSCASIRRSANRSLSPRRNALSWRLTCDGRTLMDATGASPTAIRRSDYRPPDFRVLQLDLDFNLEPRATIVRAKFSLQRTGGAHVPLVLDGEKLELL